MPVPYILRKSAEGGYCLAQQNIGLAFEEGTEVPKDLFKAYYWYSLAIKNSEDDGDLLSSKEALNRLLNQMTSAEIEEAKKLL
ncbi:sel1 repeat family protein [Amphritea pacifica]|uniref:sel1 repeat family protein n=1 Tax=Amphritea pacifica TaxID=2811233 RepID=UPI001964F597|nr:sel1 repeat family protein [Amphritea pacifica]MBN1006113.1 sel1 repeat family protein [Amphritea pacifica]